MPHLRPGKGPRRRASFIKTRSSNAAPQPKGSQGFNQASIVIPNQTAPKTIFIRPQASVWNRDW